MIKICKKKIPFLNKSMYSFSVVKVKKQISKTANYILWQPIVVQIQEWGGGNALD